MHRKHASPVGGAGPWPVAACDVQLDVECMPGCQVCQPQKAALIARAYLDDGRQQHVWLWVVVGGGGWAAAAAVSQRAVFCC